MFLLSCVPGFVFMMLLRESRFEVVKNKTSTTVTSLCSRFSSFHFRRDLFGAAIMEDLGRKLSICELDSTIKAIPQNCNQQTPDVVERIFIGLVVGMANKTISPSAKIRHETGRQTLYVSSRPRSRVKCHLHSPHPDSRLCNEMLASGAHDWHTSAVLHPKSYVIGRDSTATSLDVVIYYDPCR